MSKIPYEYSATSIGDIIKILSDIGAKEAILKLLPKNANDKNQLYLASDFGVVHDTFEVTLSERGAGSSKKKRARKGERMITEAALDKFSWLRSDGVLVQTKGVKAIIYPQYPEARLSGFQAVDGTMPSCLSVEFTKANPEAKRLLVLAAKEGGECIGIIFWQLTPELEAEIKSLPGHKRASACKHLVLESPETSARKVLEVMRPFMGRPLPGSRLDSLGNTLAFTGTQVCGYTLEHALNISSNANKDGDLFGVELKTHTSLKLTLFTPEPDFGLYAETFPDFMRKFGYQDSDGDWRLTGVHRAGILCAKSGLTLMVSEHRLNELGEWILDEQGRKKHFPYDPSTPLSAKTDAVQVVLLDNDHNVAAGWSFGRLMNNWGVKHGEVIYVPASKVQNSDAEQFNRGHEFSVTFDRTVMVCRKTSAERLLKAINDGIVFLDPAPKLHATDPAKNKRRSQWRLNNIHRDAKALYESVEFIKLD